MMKCWQLVAVVAYLGLLMAYVWVGYRAVPFHGDEADHMYKSLDFKVAIVEGRPQDLRTTVPVHFASTEHIRVMTGNVHAFLTGYALWSMGIQPTEWPAAWRYGISVEQNIEQGHWPEQRILERARVPHTILVMLSVPLTFVMAHYWRPQYATIVGVLAATFVATQPAWLLNGRRVMQEAVLVTCSLVIVLMAMQIAQRWRNWQVLLLGVMGGVCIAAKPTGLVTVAAVFLALGIVVVYHPQRLRNGVLVALAGVLCIITYIGLTPSTWSNPIKVVRYMADQRSDILKAQYAATRYAYQTRTEQIAAITEQPFVRDVQYYEIPAFDGILDKEIADYENAGYVGWRKSQPIAWLATILGGIGLVQLWRRRQHPAVGVGLVWLGVTGLALCFSVPMDWRRYYLLWDVAFCLVAAYGFDTVLQWLNGLKSSLVSHLRWHGSSSASASRGPS